MKNFILLFTLVLIIFTPFISSQAPDTLWTKTFGVGSGRKVLETSDGGYIITGNRHSGINSDVFIVKTDLNGDALWTKTYGGSGQDIGMSVQETTDGGYIIAGSTWPLGAQYNDGLVIKTNSFGDTLWTKIFGGSSYDDFLSVQQTIDEGYIIVGETSSYGTGEHDVWLLKTDSLGDTIWTKTYGGTYGDQGLSAQVTSDGGYIIAGGKNGGANNDVWLLKTNFLGDTLWTRTFGGLENDWARSVQQTSDEGYILVGATYSFGAGDLDLWLIKTNSNGDTIWTKTFGGINQEEGYEVKELSDGGYIIVGYTESFGEENWDLWLIKTDYLGNTLWTKTIGGTQYAQGFSVLQTIDKGYIITGRTGGDVWLIKLGPDLPTDIKREADIVDNYYLQQNYPNPFNPATTIKYQIPELSFVTIRVFDVLGNEIATLVNEEKPAGSYDVEFDASSLSSGIYFYGLQAGSYIETKKMVLMK